MTIAVSFRPVPDRPTTFSVWAALPVSSTLIGFVRSSGSVWIATPRAGQHPAESKECATRAEAASWLLTEGGFAHPPEGAAAP